MSDCVDAAMLREYWGVVFSDEFPGGEKAVARLMADHFRLIDAHALAEERRQEIVKAHDLLRAAAFDHEVALILPQLPANLRVSCDVLCWVLRHERNQAFPRRLELTREVLACAGGEVIDRVCPAEDD